MRMYLPMPTSGSAMVVAIILVGLIFGPVSNLLYEVSYYMVNFSDPGPTMESFYSYILRTGSAAHRDDGWPKFFGNFVGASWYVIAWSLFAAITNLFLCFIVYPIASFISGMISLIVEE